MNGSENVQTYPAGNAWNESKLSFQSSSYMYSLLSRTN